MANVTLPSSDVNDRSNSKLLRWGLIYTGPTSYVTGGDPIAPTDVGLGSIDFLDVENAYNGVNSMYMLNYVPATGKIIWYVPNTNAEVANGVNLSTYNTNFMAAGH